MALVLNMKRGPKLKLDRPVRQVLYIPESIMSKVALLLLDPLSGKMKKGAMSELTVSLYREWLEKQRQAGVDKT